MQINQMTKKIFCCILQFFFELHDDVRSLVTRSTELQQTVPYALGNDAQSQNQPNRYFSDEVVYNQRGQINEEEKLIKKICNYDKKMTDMNKSNKTAFTKGDIKLLNKTIQLFDSTANNKQKIDCFYKNLMNMAIAKNSDDVMKQLLLLLNNKEVMKYFANQNKLLKDLLQITCSKLEIWILVIDNAFHIGHNPAGKKMDNIKGSITVYIDTINSICYLENLSAETELKSGNSSIFRRFFPKFYSYSDVFKPKCFATKAFKEILELRQVTNVSLSLSRSYYLSVANCKIICYLFPNTVLEYLPVIYTNNMIEYLRHNITKYQLKNIRHLLFKTDQSINIESIDFLCLEKLCILFTNQNEEFQIRLSKKQKNNLKVLELCSVHVNLKLAKFLVSLKNLEKISFTKCYFLINAWEKIVHGDLILRIESFANNEIYLGPDASIKMYEKVIKDSENLKNYEIEGLSRVTTDLSSLFKFYSSTLTKLCLYEIELNNDIFNKIFNQENIEDIRLKFIVKENLKINQLEFSSKIKKLDLSEWKLCNNERTKRKINVGFIIDLSFIAELKNLEDFTCHIANYTIPLLNEGSKIPDLRNLDLCTASGEIMSVLLGSKNLETTLETFKFRRGCKLYNEHFSAINNWKSMQKLRFLQFEGVCSSFEPEVASVCINLASFVGPYVEKSLSSEFYKNLMACPRFEYIHIIIDPKSSIIENIPDILKDGLFVTLQCTNAIFTSHELTFFVQKHPNIGFLRILHTQNPINCCALESEAKILNPKYCISVSYDGGRHIIWNGWN